jgi:hypothetical protein
MSVDQNAKPIRVFIYLGRYFGANNWQRKLRIGKLLGINDPLPYGYHRATSDGCLVIYSEDSKENRLEWLFRLGIKAIVGVDFIHAWRNRKGIYDSDIVWTHTEQEYIAVLLLFRIFFWKPPPKLIAQSVWLFDRWHDQFDQTMVTFLAYQESRPAHGFVSGKSQSRALPFSTHPL